MKRITGWYVYKIYITYKAHFDPSNKTNIADYDFNEFNLSYEAFLNTSGKQYFDALAENLKTKNRVIRLFIAAFLDDPSLWIGDIVSNLSYYKELQEKREGKILNLSYLFRKDSIHLLESGMKFDETFPDFVFSEFMKSNIELEVFIIYKNIFRKIFEKVLDMNINYQYIYKVKYDKYEKLLVIDSEKYKKILESLLKGGYHVKNK